MIRSLLIANRGEIAVRIIRTARDLGIRTIAVFSDSDAQAPHVHQADVAVGIGPPTVTDPYLAIEQIMRAAQHSGADAVHPGYGFLAENPAFAQACAASSIVFVGPPVETIRVMGDKARAKACMMAAGVPCVPGYHGRDQDDATLLNEAVSIGWPLLIKAAAGGGGRGIRRVGAVAELASALVAARAEAKSTFGDDSLLLERLIDRARHVEIQVFGDNHGNVIHLGERDCSMQRRHQKIIEEAPSPAVTDELRHRMGECAVAAARAVGYVGAGTVEFLLAPDGSFYFLEMNTRLQVEHPVTELVTGHDLVAWQLRIAEGEPLPIRQQQLAFVGHAIQARLYAEDPYDGFLPQSGRVLVWRPPLRADVRVDAGIVEGQEITPHYDPMIAKIIASGPDRESARRRLVAALEQTVVLGPATNRDFLLEALDDRRFSTGEITTDTIDHDWREGSIARSAAPDEAWALAALLLALGDRVGNADSWCNSGIRSWSQQLEHAGELRSVTTEGEGAIWQVAIGDRCHRIQVLNRAGSRCRVEIDGLYRVTHFVRDRTVLRMTLDRFTGSFREADVHQARSSVAYDGALVAPTTGKVVAVPVELGDRVTAGQVLVVLEAMKMEHRIIAPGSGIVHAVSTTPGEQVRSRQVLVHVVLDGDSPPET